MSDQPAKKFRRSRSPHHRVVYANQTMLVRTSVDIRLRFGCVEQVTQDEVFVEDQVDVILGPLEAMSLLELLKRHLPNLNPGQLGEAIQDETETK